jgi:hypothetical protein
MANKEYNKYREELIRRYWEYRNSRFQNQDDFFDRKNPQSKRPPVFVTQHALKNVIMNPHATKDEINKLINIQRKWHQWFRSMNSSQALAQSVLGNLVVYDNIDILSEIKEDFGLPLIGKAKISSDNFLMEHEIHHLGEPRSTSLDGFFDGDYQVAIECKFTEEEIGPCSRPNLKPSASNYETDFCNGSFVQQNGRNERCSLTERGIKYWDYIPKLFKWNNSKDIKDCPLNKNYQLVRNILAVCVRDGRVSPKNGHMVLIYDERNPSFQDGGKGFSSIQKTRNSLKYPYLLRTCSWQDLINLMREKNILSWLTKELKLKYDM